MKKIILSLFIINSINCISQRYNLDYNKNSFPYDKTWSIQSKIINNQVFFEWEKAIVTSIIIKSFDNDLYFPKVDVFMISQLTLQDLVKGKYEVIFLDDCNAIMDKKEFEIK